jgi:hypothetical protein
LPNILTYAGVIRMLEGGSQGDPLALANPVDDSPPHPSCSTSHNRSHHKQFPTWIKTQRIRP